MTQRRKPYIGIDKNGDWFGFSSVNTPTRESTPEFVAVIGAFKTKKAQLWALQHGKNNPHFQTVNDAERLSKETPKESFLKGEWCKVNKDCEFHSYPEDGQCSCGVYKHHVHCNHGYITQVG